VVDLGEHDQIGGLEGKRWDRVRDPDGWIGAAHGDAERKAADRLLLAGVAAPHLGFTLAPTGDRRLGFRSGVEPQSGPQDRERRHQHDRHQHGPDSTAGNGG